MLLDRSGETGWNIKCTLVMSGGQPKGVCVCVCVCVGGCGCVGVGVGVRACMRAYVHVCDVVYMWCVYMWCYLCSLFTVCMLHLLVFLYHYTFYAWYKNIQYFELCNKHFYTGFLTILLYSHHCTVASVYCYVY